eukprot:TRINITY_DN96786_c0_g1_i1.p1 TRINITY_DN96786_c0_g1~~TRINITY_DN96786_c0_g1_i1.p1  ORF type:complete len:258 (+),score=69.83 TRINITY_DN96786_c0_g1_i1:28-774(+)
MPDAADERPTAGADVPVTADTLLTGLSGVLDAMAEAEAVSEEERSLANARCSLGEALWEQENDAQAAIAEFCGALAVNPRHVEALCGLASVLGDQGDLDGAVKALRRALQISPRHGTAHFLLGSALGRRGDFDGAVMEYQAVLEYDPESHVAALARANLEAAARVTAEHPLTYEAGLPADAIQRIEKLRWEEGMEAASCAICIRDFAVAEEVRKLRCNHLSHASCVDEWLRRRSDCPLCKDTVGVEPS